jgi:hypothetical protein
LSSFEKIAFGRSVGQYPAPDPAAGPGEALDLTAPSTLLARADQVIE